MCILGGGAQAAQAPPPPPPMPAAPPTPVDDTVVQAKNDAQQRAMDAAGVGSTVVTGGQGLTTPASTAAKKLTGD